MNQKTLTVRLRPHRSLQGPIRTCIGCRQRQLSTQLWRLVAVSTSSGETTLEVDHTGRMSGRGAWLHPCMQCLQEAIKRRALGRALRLAGVPDVSRVYEQLIQREC